MPIHAFLAETEFLAARKAARAKAAFIKMRKRDSGKRRASCDVENYGKNAMKITEFFDKMEKALESIFEGAKGEKRIKKGMDYGIERQVDGCFLIVSLDLLLLAGFVFPIATACFPIVVIVSFIAAEICIHRLNKRIAAQESEERKEDLEDDISRISLAVGIIGLILFVVLALLYARLLEGE